MSRLLVLADLDVCVSVVEDESMRAGDAPPERVMLPEKSLPARQVSPEKQLRAAILKGRFAELIVKSQEKSLPDNKVTRSELMV